MNLVNIYGPNIDDSKFFTNLFLKYIIAARVYLYTKSSQKSSKHLEKCKKNK